MTTTTEPAVITARVQKVRKLINATNTKAGKLRENPELNRSTRQRQALLLKADALDEVGRILAGKA